jgi:tetratricopeptide (TPR) repeat protein
LEAGVGKTWRYVRGSPDDLASRKSNKFALVLGASIGLLALLAHSSVDFNMHVPANAILAVSLMALLSSCLRFTSERYWLPARAGVKVVLTLVLLSGAVYLGCQGYRRLTEYVWLARAQNAASFSPGQIAFLEKAFAAEPGNFETAYSNGQAFRIESWEGDADYRELAGKAIDWFARAIKLDPYHGYSFMQYGMCLDWLGRFDEAQTQFERAVLLDPNGYFTAAHMGWHYVQKEDYAAAKTWFERSQHLLDGPGNPIPNSYLPIVERKLVELAAPQQDSKP